MAIRLRARMRRLGTGITGLLIVGLGIVLMPLPGPGMVIVLVGLGYLRRDYPWADRVLTRVRGWAVLAGPARFLSRIGGRRPPGRA